MNTLTFDVINNAIEQLKKSRVSPDYSMICNGKQMNDLESTTKYKSNDLYHIDVNNGITKITKL